MRFSRVSVVFIFGQDVNAYKPYIQDFPNTKSKDTSPSPANYKSTYDKFPKSFPLKFIYVYKYYYIIFIKKNRNKNISKRT